MIKKEKRKYEIDKEIKELGEIITGEMKLRETKDKIIQEKRKAIEQQKKKISEGIKKGDLKIKDFQKNKKVVQKIKLFEWEAPVRVPFQFEKKNFLIIVALCLIFILYLAILGHYMLMFAIISFLFLIYVAGTTKPVNITHVITAKGIETMEVLYEWFMLENFFFTEKKDKLLLIIDTNLRLPGRLILLVNKNEKDTIFLLLQDQLIYKDIKKQPKLDEINLGKYIPLEKI